VSSFLVEDAVAEEDAPPPPPGDGLIGEVGSLSSMSESGDFGPPGIPPGWGVPPLEVVLRSCGEPTLESAYLQLCTLLCVRGAGVMEGAVGPPTPGLLFRLGLADWERVVEEEGGV
jgi:hypothetical protein